MNRLSSEPTVDRHALGQGRLDLLDHRLGRLGDGERVGARLADDAEADRRIAVEPEGGIGIFRPLLDPGDVAEADQIAVAAAADDERAELLGRRERPVDPQRDVLLRRFEPPGGQLDILGPERVFDVGRGQAEGGEPLGLQPDPHRRPRLAADEDPGDAVDRGEAVEQVAVDPVGQLQPRPARLGDDQEHDRRRVGIDLADHRRLDLGRQVAGRGADPVADVVGGAVDVAAGGELDGDVGLAVARARGDRLQPLEAGELLLEHLGDAGLDDVGGGADIAWSATETTGGSTSGYSRTDRLKKPTIPTTAISIATTAAKTGRLTERSESFIA